MRITLKEFEERYCQDILELQVERADGGLPSIFNYDQHDGDGRQVILDSKGEEIPIADIVGLSFEEFTKSYPHTSNLEAFQNYTSAYKVTVGEEVIDEVLLSIQREAAKLDSYNEEVEGDILDL